MTWKGRLGPRKKWYIFSILKIKTLWNSSHYPAFAEVYGLNSMNDECSLVFL